MELDDDKKVLILRLGHCCMDPQPHSRLHFILKPTKKEIGNGMGLFNSLSGEIKTKLLTLPLLWAYRRTTKCTLHLDSRQFHVNPISLCKKWISKS